MITFKQALKIARRKDPEVDIYSETRKAYMFIQESDIMSIGPSPIVVMKDTGEVLNYLSYLALLRETGQQDEDIRMQVRI
ncbi:MAG: hypothetical protein IKX74_02750 [Erysipelotrichaceae bacterium]|nr:hypothetical protein [Erysipelotrichaceae bacterium]